MRRKLLYGLAKRKFQGKSSEGGTVINTAALGPINPSFNPGDSLERKSENQASKVRHKQGRKSKKTVISRLYQFQRYSAKKF